MTYSHRSIPLERPDGGAIALPGGGPLGPTLVSKSAEAREEGGKEIVKHGEVRRIRSLQIGHCGAAYRVSRNFGALPIVTDFSEWPFLTRSWHCISSPFVSV